MAPPELTNYLVNARESRVGSPRRSTAVAPTPAPPAPRSFAAAADAFSRRGFDGVTVDDIARAAGVNKAMIYYHFADKLTLYRDIVCEMLDAAGARVSAIVAEPASPAEKLRAVHRRLHRAGRLRGRTFRR